VKLPLPDRIQQRLSQVSYNVEGLESPVPEIEALITRGLVAGGKRVRPLLSLLVADWIGLDEARSLQIARAVELVHAASLAHDDVIDESDLRRRKPTLRRLSSNSRAVLAGDLLLSRTLREVTELGNLDLVKSLARSAEMLVYGEWLQQELIGEINVSESQLSAVHHKKTGSLMEWACTAPLQILPADSVSFARTDFAHGLKELGRLVGAAFQIIDDVVDFSAESEKPFAQDLREGLVNSVTLRIISRNPSLKGPLSHCLGVETPPQGYPWSQDELAYALTESRSQAAAQIFAAGRILEELHALHPIPPDVRLAFESLFEVLKERKK
jgi:geranylgeranyl pyrophosphate synthase